MIHRTKSAGLIFATLLLLAGSIAPHAQAAIIYSGVQNLSVAQNINGLFINLQTTVSSGLPGPSGWDLNFFAFPFAGTDTLTVSPAADAQVVQDGTGSLALLTVGTLISGASNLTNGFPLLAGSPGPWQSVTGGYAGFKFTDSTSAVHFGWIRITTGAASGFPATIVDWAYDSGSGTIHAGDLPVGGVPEPSTSGLVLLGLGLVGAGWRKRPSRSIGGLAPPRERLP